MSEELEARERDFAAAVAAAAFAIQSLELASRKVEIASEVMPSSRRLSKLFSNEDDGEITKKREEKVNERTLSTKKPIGVYTKGEDRHQLAKAISKRHNDVENKVDIWVRDQMAKVLKRYEKTKYTISAWENEKKFQAKVKLERRKRLLELRRKRNMQYYQNKIARINHIAGGARIQLEERRKNEELMVKDEAKRMRNRRNVGLKFLCFTC